MPARGPQPGDLIADRYRLDLMIGTGGMGAVWSCSVAGSSDEKIALKFLHSQLASDPLMVQRFLLEARAGLEIRHPNVVKVIAQGTLQPTDPRDDPTPWLAMELLHGKTLGEALRLRGRLEAVDALAIMADVTAGTAAAHAKGIVHRDIKPGNVFLQETTSSGATKITPKLLDFGISKYVDPGLDGGLTSTGAIVGSATYMSPEQAAGGYNIDQRTDVWSLGVMMYRLLTGESPLGAAKQPEVLVLLGSPQELDLTALKHPRIPATVADIVRRCLRKKREERWPSAIELETELKAALAAESATTRAPDIDTLLRPASSAATFIAAPLDAEPEATAHTAPTGYVVDAANRQSPATAHANPLAGLASTLPLQAQTPRSGAARATMKMDVPAHASIPPASPSLPTPERRASIWPKLGAVALGIAIVAVGGTAWRYRSRPAMPAFANPEPPTSVSAAPATSDTVAEIEDTPADAPSATASAAATTVKPKSSGKVTIKPPPRGTTTSRPPPPPPPKPSPEAWRNPGF